MSDVSTASLARRLGVTQRRANDLIRAGRVVARKSDSGAWRVSTDSITAFEAQRRTRRGITTEAAWAMLLMLADSPARWVSDSTRARLSARLRQSEVEQVAWSVAARTTTHRFRAANPERAGAGLLLTARSAAPRVGTALLPDSRHVQGYVPAGKSVAQWADSHFMVADDTGRDVLYDNTMPAALHGLVIVPDSVVAADLAVSVDARERTAGLLVLRSLVNRWRDRHG